MDLKLSRICQTVLPSGHSYSYQKGFPPDGDSNSTITAHYGFKHMYVPNLKGVCPVRGSAANLAWTR